MNPLLQPIQSLLIFRFPSCCGAVLNRCDRCDSDLEKFLKKRGANRLEEEEVWPIFLGAAAGLYAVHSAGILHRDLKPSNYLMQHTSSGRPLIKLADFGLAKQAKSSSTQHSHASGTLHWKSPEKLAGGVFGKRSDVWSLGCIGYELCTLVNPFWSQRNGYAQVMTGSYIPLEFTWSQELRDIIAACLKVESKERPFVAQLLPMVPKERLRALDAALAVVIEKRTDGDGEEDLLYEYEDRDFS